MTCEAGATRDQGDRRRALLVRPWQVWDNVIGGRTGTIHSGAAGIQRVAVRRKLGRHLPWRSARLRDPPASNTW